MARPADPVRRDVEATLHRLVTATAAGPCGMLKAARRVVGESVGLARTIVNLTVDGLLGWEVDAGVPRLETVGAGATAAAHPIVDRSADRAGGPATGGQAVDADDLAISGYEDLAASHIVARLDRLNRSELAEIRTFEVANRGRRTVVGKIDQLLARS